jgi:hypothetical protein
MFKLCAFFVDLVFFKPEYLLNTEPLTSLGCLLNAVFHVLRGPVP